MPYVENANARIYYEVHGESDRPALVLAHGAGGSTLSWWQQIPHFSAGYRVVVFDHRIFGRSVCTADDFHPRHFPADLLAILDAEGIERTAIVAQSMGGWTGLPTALGHPERVSCLVLAGTPGGVFTEAVMLNAMRVLEMTGDEGIPSSAALAPNFPEREPELAGLYDQINALNERFEPALLARMADDDLRLTPEKLMGYSTPTMMIVGEHDQLFPPEVLHEVAGVIPGAEIRDIPIAGHSTYFETPGPFNELVDEFLAKHWPA